MTCHMCDKLKLVEEQNRQLTEIVREVSGINVDVLSFCLDTEKHPEAKAELDRLSSLVRTIQVDPQAVVKEEVDENEECPTQQQQNSCDDLNEDEDNALTVAFLPQQTEPEISTQGNSLKPVQRLKRLRAPRGSLPASTTCAVKQKTGYCDHEGDSGPEDNEFPVQDILIQKNVKPGDPSEYPDIEDTSSEVINKSVVRVVWSNHSEANVDQVPLLTVTTSQGMAAKKKATRFKKEGIQLEKSFPQQKKKRKGNKKKGGHDEGSEIKAKTSKLSPQGPCVCERCGKIFKSKDTLRLHTKLHREKDANLIYNCDICGKQFNLKTSLYFHKRCHSSVKDFLCTKCGKCFRKQHALKLHMRSHNGEKPHVCSFCNKSFSAIGNLRRHEKIHTGEKPYMCSSCGKAFNQSDNLKSHMKSHSTEKKFKCSLCGKSFSRSSLLHEHRFRIHQTDIIKQHPSTNLFECSFCQEKFMDEEGLTTHIKTHSREKPYQCSFCLRSFSKKVQLAVHTRIHTGFKPYKCDLCEKAFTRSMALKEHKNIHSGKVYECEVCNKAFNRLANLTRHLLLHSGIKRFRCQMCEREFSQKAALDAHMWTHTREKRFKCEVCGKGYNDKRNLVSHSKTHGQNTISVNEIPTHN